MICVLVQDAQFFHRERIDLHFADRFSVGPKFDHIARQVTDVERLSPAEIRREMKPAEKTNDFSDVILAGFSGHRCFGSFALWAFSPIIQKPLATVEMHFKQSEVVTFPECSNDAKHVMTTAIK